MSSDPPTAPATAEPPRTRRWPRVLTTLVILVALAGGGAYYYRDRLGLAAPESGAPADAKAATGADKAGKGGIGRRGPGGPPPVVAAPVTTEDFDVRLAALGTVTARNSVVVRSRVDGPLIKVHFREGQKTRVGDLLAEIDPQPFKVQLDQMNGQLRRDQALLQNAMIDLDRYKALLATDSIARQQVDTQEATVRQYQGVVAADMGQVDAAKLQLSYTRITAPLAGQVGLRLVDPGNMVRSGDANGIVTITQMDPITVVFAIPENQVTPVLARVRGGEDIRVEAWDAGQKTRIAEGRLLSTDNQIDVATGTLKLKAEFANKEGALFPNQFVNMRVLLGRETGLTVVPSAAVQRGSQGTFAYVVQADSTVARRAIVTGLSDGERIAITSGLKAGERVVIDGIDRLRDGMRVEVIDRNTPPAGAKSADDVEREARRRRFREIMEKGTEEQKAEAQRRFRERQESGKAGGGVPSGAAPAGQPAAGAPAASPAAGSTPAKAPAAVPAEARAQAIPPAAPPAGPTVGGAPRAGGEPSKWDSMSDAEREARRARFREIMEKGTEEQKAEAQRRFRERQEAMRAGQGGTAPAPRP